MTPQRWTPDAPPTADLPPAVVARLERKAQLGSVLIALGLLAILWGVFHMLSGVGGPERPEFASRQTYNEVKPLIHQHMLGALTRSLGGLFLAMTGGTLRRHAQAALRVESQ